MPSEFERLNELPTELQSEIAKKLPNHDLVSLAQTSKYHLLMFQPMLDVRKFLNHVTHGEHDEVNAMLHKDVRLLLKRGIVKDCSGRIFENVSGFEYALWALDKYMWTNMIACIPKNNEEGRIIFAKLIDQYTNINKTGITYKLSEETITERHFDFKNTIIKELQTQVDLINAPGGKDWDTIHKQWLEGVGGSQKLLPMHIIYEYCSDKKFEPVPQFTSQPKSSTRLYNWVSNEYNNWFSVSLKLSIDVAVYKSFGNLCQAGKGTILKLEGSSMCQIDLKAMIALYKVRTNDFTNLKSELEDKMMIGNFQAEVPTIPGYD